MKNFIRFPLALLALAALVFTIDSAYPKAARAYAQDIQFTKTGPSSKLAVAAGALIDSGVLDMNTSTECTVFADNSAGGSTRNLIINFLGNDQTTIVYQQSIALTTTTRGMAVISNAVAAAAVPTGFTILPTKVTRYMQFQLSSAGAAAGSLNWACR